MNVYDHEAPDPKWISSKRSGSSTPCKLPIQSTILSTPHARKDTHLLSMPSKVNTWDDGLHLPCEQPNAMSAVPFVSWINTRNIPGTKCRAYSEHSSAPPVLCDCSQDDEIDVSRTSAPKSLDSTYGTDPSCQKGTLPQKFQRKGQKRDCAVRTNVELWSQPVSCNRPHLNVQQNIQLCRRRDAEERFKMVQSMVNPGRRTVDYNTGGQDF